MNLTQIVLLALGALTFWAPVVIARSRPRTSFWLTAVAVPAAALLGTAFVAVAGPTVIDTFLSRLLVDFYLGATLAALIWLFRTHPPGAPFDPRWLFAVPASGWLSFLLLRNAFSYGDLWPVAMAVLQLVVIGALWVATRSRPTASATAASVDELVAYAMWGQNVSAPADSPTVAPAPAPEPTPPAPPPQKPQPVEAMPEAVDAPPRTGRLFISYRREDSAYIADRISERLTQRFGRDAVFKDVDSIPLGQDFRKHLKDAVGRCDVLIAVIGKQWYAAQAETGKRRIDDPRDHLRIEIESALERNIPVIPVLVQGAFVPTEEELPESLKPLAYRNAQQVRPDPDFTTDLERLMRGIESQLPARS